MQERTYIAIDLKSFYASVECMDRGLDPLTTNLVVADLSRTEKTICLAVSPSLKAYGISGRARLFEVVQKVREMNAMRQQKAPGRRFTGSSCQDPELRADPALALDYVTAPPQMARYMEISGRIYEVYLRYIAPEDIHVYSIDEVFIDATSYLKTYGMSARELARTMILDVLKTTGITATAGIGTNLYLCKVAMDIDFWRVGRGYAKKLEERGLYTMGDIARCSLGGPADYYNEDLLYQMFGVNAELLIDHAWGWEPCTIADIKSYRPRSSSVGSGQVLHCPYPFDKAKLVAKEMADQLALDLAEKGLAADQIVLTVGYDIDNLRDVRRRKEYRGEVKTDRYGRKVPKHAHGTSNLTYHTSSARQIIQAVTGLFDRIVDPKLLIRRITISAEHVIPRNEVEEQETCGFEQMTLFTDYAAREKEQEQKKAEEERESRMQEAVLEIRRKFGKNALLRGMDLQEGATAKDRNSQIGGHRA